MRLKQIKLAGFKSFVDPTTVAFPSNLSGIVGPNGCGKSNIIDAVRWVMGESSAKHLRGESMADVIFNGSTARKPAGQASIELHFDNHDGGLGGMYAQYPEIVIRRQVNHDGQSVYFLNGTVCRRRDITDIFLGTGLGPRSYAIIEQGTISRLIEAKPEELRIYLEEAAGISKYKERRRETELRLQHTRDNLARLTDLRDELQKQLDHLTKQAATAEKYQHLKDQERNLRAQLLALRARNLQQQSIQEQQVIISLEQQLEEQNAQWQSLATQRELQQQTQISHADEVQVAQREYYQCNTELARIEQNLQHHRDRQRQLQIDLQQAKQEAQQAQQQLVNEENRTTDLTQQLNNLIPQVTESQTLAHQAHEDLQQLEAAMHEAQKNWDHFHQQSSTITQKAQVEQTRIQHLEKHLLIIQERLTRIEQEQEKYTQMELPLGIQNLQSQIEAINNDILQKQQQLLTVQQQLQAYREIYQTQQQEIDKGRTELQSLRGRFASLQALQEAALGKNEQSTINWLQQNHLENNPRLVEQITVDAGWEIAVETVLSEYLEAICVEDVTSLLPTLSAQSQSIITLVEGNMVIDHSAQPQHAAQLLLTKLQAPAVINTILQDIYIAETVEQAIIMIKQLAAQASVITRDGIWVGKGWFRIIGKAQEKSGVLLREKELAEIQQQISKQVSTVEKYQQNLEASQQSLQQLEAERENVQKNLSLLSAQHADVCAQLKVQQAQLTQTQQRKSQLNQEAQELLSQQQQENEALQVARATWQSLMQQTEQDALQRENLQQQRDSQRQQLQVARPQSHQIQQQAHQLATQVEVLQTQLAASQQYCQRLVTQLEITSQKQININEQLSSSYQPEEQLKTELNQWLSQQQVAEKLLQEKRQLLSEVEEQLRSFEKQQHAIDEGRLQVRAQLEQQRLQQQSHQVRLQSLTEQLHELHCELEETKAQLPDDALESTWEDQLAKVVQRIERLGPINLAAISEHAALAERKNYLDQQHEDLVTALTTLEDAIRKIDKETRQRFKDVYEKVNETFQGLFPRIFGGGNAYLELTGDDLLQTGVNVIARPPGKRNSTIHLLSGGEKALTAIALVFAIFQLNPAPFCMLDEVDAPLDDANIGRFCELVKEMAKSVQFIFISHNKLAIEMAEHLLGVTMQEPGVSRLVAVDMNAAMEMAAAA